MNNLTSQFSTLKNNLESIAFLVSKGSSEKEAHTEVVRSLVLLAQIETNVNELIKTDNFSYEQNPAKPNNNQSSNIDAEIKKVRRKSPRWFKKTDQKNSMILIGFLELSSQNSHVSTQMLQNKCQLTNDVFERNYNQMKHFGEKNNGKVFEENNGIVSLWEPVQEFIIELYHEHKKVA